MYSCHELFMRSPHGNFDVFPLVDAQIIHHFTTMDPCVVWELPSRPMGDTDCRDIIFEKPYIVGAQPTVNYAI